MDKAVFETLIEWFRQYSLSIPLNNSSEPNAFIPVGDGEIARLEGSTSLYIPETYRTFLTKVGFGRFRSGINKTIYGEINFFLAPEEIEDRLDRSSGHWEADPDFLSDGEFPFFEFDQQEYFVFRSDLKNDSVWLPNKRGMICDNFPMFLRKLSVDAGFYIDLVDNFYI